MSRREDYAQQRNEQGNPISAHEIPPTTSAISTRRSRGVITKSRAAQLALELQERVIKLKKREKVCTKKKEGIQNMKAEQLLPRKENVS